MGREAEEDVGFKACTASNCITPHNAFVPIFQPTSGVASGSHSNTATVNPVANGTLKERIAARKAQQVESLYCGQISPLPTSTESQPSQENAAPLGFASGLDSASIPSSINREEFDDSWMVEHAVYLIEKHKKKHLQGAWVGRDIEEAKKEGLTSLQEGLKDSLKKYKVPKQALSALINTEAGKSDNNKHRFFFNQIKGDTDTVLFLESLAERVAPIAGAA